MLLTTVVTPFSNTDWLVCFLGVSIVFLGLVGIIGVCKLLGVICRSPKEVSQTEKTAQPSVSNAAQQDEDIPNREQLVAAVSAALAEYMGEEANSLRIVSIKKI